MSIISRWLLKNKRKKAASMREAILREHNRLSGLIGSGGGNIEAYKKALSVLEQSAALDDLDMLNKHK